MIQSGMSSSSVFELLQGFRPHAKRRCSEGWQTDYLGRTLAERLGCLLSFILNTGEQKWTAWHRFD